MVKTFLVRNTNEAMYPVYSWLNLYGIVTDSRAGLVIRAPAPVVITYTHPWERVNLCPIRDANPFFHLLESLWMIAGSNELAPLANVLPSFADYSDDGTTLNAAYGYRARHHFDSDQLADAASKLRSTPNTRQAVVQLWAVEDLIGDTRDRACNTQLIFARDPGTRRLGMTVINRSNDAIWGGVSGANVVHLSYLHEYVATSAGMRMGVAHVFSNNLHIYKDNPKAEPLLERYQHHVPSAEVYTLRELKTAPLLMEYEDPMSLDMDAVIMMEWMKSKLIENLYAPRFRTHFMNEVAAPMMLTFRAHKNGQYDLAREFAATVIDDAWKIAAMEWLDRRWKDEAA